MVGLFTSVVVGVTGVLVSFPIDIRVGVRGVPPTMVGRSCWPPTRMAAVKVRFDGLQRSGMAVRVQPRC